MAGNWNSGRRPTPRAVHVLRGTVRADHAKRDEKSRGTPGRPPMPANVAADAEARAHWDRLAAITETEGTLTTAHGDLLALLSLQRAMYDRVVAELVGAAMTMTNSRRRTIPNPLIREAQTLAAQCDRLLGEFGLTPLTQGRVTHADRTPPAIARASRYITPRVG
jgi:phage terminase small subunit